MGREIKKLLAIFLFLSAFSAFVVGKSEYSSVQSNCVFPKFLQTPCKTSVQICHWSQGRHFSKKDNGHTSKYQEIYSEWRWVVNESRIVVSSGLDTEEEKTSKIITCKKQVESKTFLILLEHSSKKTIMYSCVKFTQRGENVLELKMAHLKGTMNENLCQEELLSQKNLLIASTFKELNDCPADLQGGFVIEKVYDVAQQSYCSTHDNSRGIFETDCMRKEGVFIDWQGTANCSFGNFLGHFENKHLYCYSPNWQDEDFSYFITKRRYRSGYDVRRETQESEFQCIKYKWTSKTQLTVYLYKDPICYQEENRKLERKDAYVIYMRKSNKIYQNANITNEKCTFPKSIQGSWLEPSHHLGYRSINVTSNKIKVSETGQFECQETFGGISYERCVDDYSRGWPLPGRVQYFDNEFMLTSRYHNGCRERMTRLAIKTWKNNYIIYRVSQSLPIRRTRRATAEKFYEREMIYFCYYEFLFSLDPFPYWGRNIEKMITRLPLQDDKFSECPIFKGKCGFTSSPLGAHTRSCNGTISSSSSGTQLTYKPSCLIPQITYRCLKDENVNNQIYKGFSIIRSLKDKRIFCIYKYFDRTLRHDVILRFDSLQCSDIDWPKVVIKGGAALYEKLILYEECNLKENTMKTERRKSISEDPTISSSADEESVSQRVGLDVKMVEKTSSGAVPCLKNFFLLILNLMLYIFVSLA